MRTNRPCWPAPKTPPLSSSPPPAAARRWPGSCPPWLNLAPPRPPASTRSTSRRSRRSPPTSAATCAPRSKARACPSAIEDRTGDTTYTQRRRQRADPPHILLTTPESLALLLSYEDAPRIFQSLQRVVIDELHALAESKRGDQLMLLLSRLESLSPNLRRVGLSATVEDPPALARFLAPTSLRHPASRSRPRPRHRHAGNR